MMYLLWIYGSTYMKCNLLGKGQGIWVGDGAALDSTDPIWKFIMWFKCTNSIWLQINSYIYKGILEEQ